MKSFINFFTEKSFSVTMLLMFSLTNEYMSFWPGLFTFVAAGIVEMFIVAYFKGSTY